MPEPSRPVALQAGGPSALPPSSSVPATSAPWPSPTPVGPLGNDIAELVAALRGRAFTKVVDVSRLDARAFEKRIARATTTQEITEGERLVRRAFGLGPRERNVHGAVARGKYVGLYDFHAHELFVRDDLGARDEGVVAHELVHALQDQWFGLIGENAEPDAALAAAALYEGDAVLLRERIAARRAGEDERMFIERATHAVETLPAKSIARAVGAPERVVEARDHDREEALFPYLAGFRFVAKLYLAGGTAAIDAAYARPPRTTREVLHPEHYAAATDTRVALPTHVSLAGEAGALGELRTGLVLARCGGGVKARTNGFLGDRFVVVASPNETDALVWKSVWETPADASRFAVDLQRARACFPGGAGENAIVVRDNAVVLARGPRAAARATTATR